MWRLLEAIPAPIKASIAIGKTSMVPMMRKRLVVPRHAQMLAYVASIAVLEACG